MTIVTSILFSFLAFVLYSASASLVAKASTPSEVERLNGLIAIGSVCVFALVLWLRLEAV